MFYIIQFARNLYRLSAPGQKQQWGRKRGLEGPVPPFTWTDGITCVSPSGK